MCYGFRGNKALGPVFEDVLGENRAIWAVFWSNLSDLYGLRG